MIIAAACLCLAQGSMGGSSDHPVSASDLDADRVELVCTIPVGAVPRDIRFSVDGKRAYVIRDGELGIAVVDCSRLQIAEELSADRMPIDAEFNDPDVTRDGILGFSPDPDSGIVTVTDLLNEETAARIAVGAGPVRGALMVDDTNYIVACGADDSLAWINTASFEVIARVKAGIGPGPLGVAIGPKGRWALVGNAGDDSVSVLDLTTRTVVSRVPVGERPTIIRVHPDGRHAYVACEGNESVCVVSLPESDDPESAEPRLNQVFVVGTIHGGHETSERYDLKLLEALVREIDPDHVLAEIPPNRAEAAMAGFLRYGEVRESRVARFPEYVKVLYPLTRELDFEIVPTAGWTEPMARYRQQRLGSIGQDPNRSDEWAEYEAAGVASAQCLSESGEGDDPYFIHTDEYDACVELELSVYDRLFNDELGPGGWTEINRAHYKNIERALDAHSGAGRRFLVTYGAGHKGWFLRELRKRTDIELVDLIPVLKRAEAALGRL